MLIESRFTEKSIVLIVVWLSAFGMPIMLSATNVAVPVIASQFNLSATQITWIPMAYLMASAMFVLTFGRLADIVGRKRIFFFGLLILSLSSIFAALATTGSMLLLGRAFQGFGAAMLYATQTAMVSSVYPAKERGKAIGITLAAVYLGLALGPTLGGIVMQYLSWRFNFVLHIPLIIIIMILITKVPEDSELKLTENFNFDKVGSCLYAVSIGLLCFGVSNLPDLSSLLMLILFLVTAALFIKHSLRSAFPIWDLRIFASNTMLTRSCLASFLMYAATYSNVVILSLYLQDLRQLSPSQAGLIMSIQPGTMAILSATLGRLSDVIEPRFLATIGMVISAFSLFSLSFLASGELSAYFLISLVFIGVGFSLFSSPNTHAIMSSVTRKNYGLASGTAATTRVLGQLSSMFLISFSLSFIVGDQLITEETLPSLLDAIELSFFIAGFVCLLGALLSVTRGKLHE